MESKFIENARQEITILNAFTRAGIIPEDTELSNDRAIEQGAKILLNN